jgi:cyclin K
LCLQWEPEIIAIAVLYLACKLSKFEITDWTTKKENSKQKWWEQFVEGLTKDIIEG